MKVPDEYILFIGIGGQFINFMLLTNEKHMLKSRSEFFTVPLFCECKDGKYWQAVNTFKNSKTVHLSQNAT